MNFEDSLHFRARETSRWPPVECAIWRAERLRAVPYLARLTQGFHSLLSAPTPFHLSYIARDL